ncbi:MAG TPA: Gfo/Idh/MocA family oxidoreductase [Candidatus Paceibacterota bacterium]|nr:Gfo/Idh/MocA family oxidoreductase [Candidatus Paceibacterota bacterium]
MSRLLRVAIVGCGGITLQNHLPGLALCPGTRVTALCDANPAVLERARGQTGVSVLSTRFEEVVGRDDVDAVIIATPNHTHPQIALAAVAQGKHVLCEKPLALNAADALAMAEAAERAGVRHMTAFTYRFVPAMRYLHDLVKRGDLGQPYHYRSCRLQDWGTRNLGWRQVRALAGTGELGDMLSHRIDFAHLLIGPMRRLVAQLKRIHPIRGDAPSDLDDWVALLAEFECGATGVLESSKLASGRNESWRSLDSVEVNGSERSFVFITGRWNQLETGRAGGPGLETIPVPEEYWRWPGSPRDPRVGDPLVTFRYDQAWEFVDAIRQQRPCIPDLFDGARVQAVMDAAVRSAGTGQWTDLAPAPRVSRIGDHRESEDSEM